MLPIELWELSCSYRSSSLSVDRKFQKGQSGDNDIQFSKNKRRSNITVVLYDTGTGRAINFGQ
jgi:hypothetical protein